MQLKSEPRIGVPRKMLQNGGTQRWKPRATQLQKISPAFRIILFEPIVSMHNPCYFCFKVGQALAHYNYHAYRRLGPSLMQTSVSPLATWQTNIHMLARILILLHIHQMHAPTASSPRRSCREGILDHPFNMQFAFRMRSKNTPFVHPSQNYLHASLLREASPSRKGDVRLTCIRLTVIQQSTS